MKKLSTKVGSFTDRYLIKLLKTYRMEHRCGEVLLSELLNGGKVIGANLSGPSGLMG